ncbi:hypothetical protein GGR32_000176 [Mesonia hippocampi]|uniref:Secretion system C-terminal sorting domain-containing protein n=1 Tax=Mesonia hippocampi TaxID=1628250 RepID=A0A840EUY9_9FLAO|nr:T9SS type A sorting domain-containing protein [Mesonia hippocampi]MBB4117904.1 hypothetical protein [Mesonia hippocampi]
MKPIYIVTFLMLVLSSSITAQQKQWQWIKQGGASSTTDNTIDPEEVYDIATDSDRNVYVLSPIGYLNPQIDGHQKNYYGGGNDVQNDYALASFACDGSYRWSKIIGGRGYEPAPYIETDNNNNLYIAGSSYRCDGQNYPFRIENDTILSNNTYQDCSLGYITKFDKNGTMLWFEQPMDRDSTSTLGGGANKFTSFNTAIDKSTSIIYWLTYIPPGSYDNGNYVNTRPGNTYHIFKYDANGNFLGAVYLDIQLTGIAGNYLKMYRNPNNGNYYFTGRRFDNGNQPSTATIGGQQVSGSLYLACFNPQGDFQWLRQNTYNQGVGTIIYGLDFDNQNNIYMGGVFLGFGYDTFLGQSVPEQIVPRFVMKTNPDATQVDWFSTDSQGFVSKAGFRMKNDVVAFTAGAGRTNFTWGNKSISITSDGTFEPLLAFFDKDTGETLELTFIPGNPGNSDNGTALDIDANGDVLLGGALKHTLYDANGGQVMNPNPSNTNFFIAKYALEPCPELGTNTWKTQSIKLWPNPANREIHISVLAPSSYRMYIITGQLVKEGKLNTGKNSLNLQELPSGLYLIETTNQQGNKQVKKIVKE